MNSGRGFYVLAIAGMLLFDLVSCKMSKEESRISKGLQHEVDAFSRASLCKDAEVKEMRFQSAAVFVFDEGTCIKDKESRVLNVEGKELGRLGGFSGNTLINHEDFSSAVPVKVIWRKEQPKANVQD
ncbi:MAG TPA: hypothetical protein PLQ93_11965 [Bacteroidia bacterium]|nr:hypothetical protein [Bacteroidia bacterium]